MQRARPLLRGLVAAVAVSDWDAAHAAARSLSGLGPGLTPSGDDALAGLALGLRSAAGLLPAPLADALGRAVVGRTTDLAGARLRHAVDGRPDEATHAVLLALLTDAGPPMQIAVGSLLDYGHTSGADTLVGLLLGVRLGVSGRDQNPGHDTDTPT